MRLVTRGILPRERSPSPDHAAQRGIQRVDMFSAPLGDEKEFLFRYQLMRAMSKVVAQP